MAFEKEFLTASFVVLSKIRKLRSGEMPEIESIEELEKALAALSSFSTTGRERSLVGSWRTEVGGIRSDAEEALLGLQRSLRDLADLLQEEVTALLLSRLPEGEFKARVEKELARVVSGDDTMEAELRPDAKREGKPVSDLERKLEIIESEITSMGLERYLKGKEIEDLDGD